MDGDGDLDRDTDLDTDLDFLDPDLEREREERLMLLERLTLLERDPSDRVASEAEGLSDFFLPDLPLLGLSDLPLSVSVSVPVLFVSS